MREPEESNTKFQGREDILDPQTNIITRKSFINGNQSNLSHIKNGEKFGLEMHFDKWINGTEIISNFEHGLIEGERIGIKYITLIKKYNIEEDDHWNNFNF